MQVIAEFLTAIVVWIAAAVLAQFGVEVDLDRHARPPIERVVEPRAEPASRAGPDVCPEEAARARGRELAAV